MATELKLASNSQSPFKKKAAHLALLFLFCFPFGSVNAESYSVQWQWELAADAVYYQEFDEQGARLNKESNVIPHVNLAVQKNLTNNTSIKLNAGLSHGYVAYDGQLQNGAPYRTTSRMTLKQGAALWQWAWSENRRIWLGFGEMRWDRHILATGNVQTLSEYYDWQRIIMGAGYRLQEHDLQVSFERLVNAGLDVDLRPWNRGVLKVHMPDGVQLGARYEYLPQDAWYYFIDTSYRYFDRGPTTISGTSGFTEPENHFVQVKWGVGYHF